MGIWGHRGHGGDVGMTQVTWGDMGTREGHGECWEHGGDGDMGGVGDTGGHGERLGTLEDVGHGDTEGCGDRGNGHGGPWVTRGGHT